MKVKVSGEHKSFNVALKTSSLSLIKAKLCWGYFKDRNTTVIIST